MKNRLLVTYGLALIAFGAPWLLEMSSDFSVLIIVLTLISCAVCMYLICSTIVLYRLRGLWSLLAVPFVLYWPVWFYAWG